MSVWHLENINCQPPKEAKLIQENSIKFDNLNNSNSVKDFTFWVDQSIELSKQLDIYKEDAFQTDIRMHSVLTTRFQDPNQHKHAAQIASLIGHLDPLVTAPCNLVEIGCGNKSRLFLFLSGKAKFSLFIHKALHERELPHSVYLLDYQPFKGTQDHYIRTNICHTILSILYHFSEHWYICCVC